MQQLFGNWVAENPMRRTVPLPIGNEGSWYHIEPDIIVDYVSAHGSQRSLVSVLMRESRRGPEGLRILDVGVDVEWIDQRMKEATFWPIHRKQ
jgi:hypothetical protein